MSQLIPVPLVRGLTSTSANLWGRCGESSMQHAYLGQQPDLSDAVLTSKSLHLSSNDGYSGVAPMQYLSPTSIIIAPSVWTSPIQARLKIPILSLSPFQIRDMNSPFQRNLGSVRDMDTLFRYG